MSAASSGLPVASAAQPEIQSIGGTVQYTLGGVLHREDGPALIAADGSERWYRHGKLHRTDGPAIDAPRGQWFFIDGVEVTRLPHT